MRLDLPTGNRSDSVPFTSGMMGSRHGRWGRSLPSFSMQVTMKNPKSHCSTVHLQRDGKISLANKGLASASRCMKTWPPKNKEVTIASALTPRGREKRKPSIIHPCRYGFIGAYERDVCDTGSAGTLLRTGRRWGLNDGKKV